MTKILVADDEPMIREALKRILESEGYEICEADNGKAACEAVSKNSPDLVLLDAMMPVMDGFQVLKTLRDNPATSSLPIIMLTATLAEYGEQIAMDYKVSHYIFKPCQPDMVRAAVRLALRPVEIPLVEIPTEPESTNILIVDDEPMMREALRNVLESEGYDVSQAENGRDACEAVSNNLPHLVLLDAMMPLMDGFQVLDVLRKNPDTANLPVIMLTSTPAEFGEQAALNYGVAHYISKPWNADMVHSAVKSVLRSVNVPIPTPPPIVEPDDSEDY